MLRNPLPFGLHRGVQVNDAAMQMHRHDIEEKEVGFMHAMATILMISHVRPLV
jgi:hypothetical protein